MIKTKNENTNIFSDEKEFEAIISDLTTNWAVQEMNQYIQHFDTSCFDHCKKVAYYSYLICKKHGLDYRSAARGAMLHDLFLYNWRKSQRDVKLEGLHSFVHPKIAFQNAIHLFQLNEKEQDIILKHMWPLTIFAVPKYRESFIITFVDKYCAIEETLTYFQKKKRFRQLSRYAYIFLAMVILRL